MNTEQYGKKVAIMKLLFLVEGLYGHLRTSYWEGGSQNDWLRLKEEKKEG